MKEFFRMLRQYVKPYKSYMAGSLLFNLLSALLNVFSFISIIPMLQLLFGIDQNRYEFIPWSAAGMSMKDIGIFDGDLLGLSTGQAGFDLTQTAPCFQTIGLPLGKQVSGLAPDLDGGLGAVEIGVQSGQFGITGRQIGGQQQAGLGGVGTCSALFGERGFQLRAVLAPKIQLVTEIEAETADIIPVFGREFGRGAIVVTDFLPSG